MGVENIRMYCPGGYHPVHLGDKFNDRYIVEHKLGYGGFSTVWLAQDTEMQRLVALKVNVAADDDSFCHDAFFLHILNPRPQTPQQLREWNTLKGKESFSRVYPSFFPQLLDEFTISGPNGEHRCLVTDVFGPSLGDLPGTQGRLPKFAFEVARKIAIQLVLAVTQLSECGIVHADLHPGNVLFRIPGIESWTVANAYDHFGKPRLIKRADIQIPFQSNPLPMSPHLPEYLVHSPPISNLETLCLESPSIAIVDFGVSFHWTGPEDDSHMEIGSPPSFAAPEVQLNDTITPACDVWSLGCLLYSLFYGNVMWITRLFSPNDSLFDISLCFDLPNSWCELWRGRGMYYNEGVLKPEEQSLKESRGDFEEKIRLACAGMEQDEYAWIRSIMLGIFKIDPKERMLAVDVLCHVPDQWLEAMPTSAAQ